MRCNPGDKLEIIDGLLYINNELSKLPYRAKPLFNYRVTSQNGISSKELLKINVTGFSRKFKISGINSNRQFEGIRPYISSLINSDIENFIVTTGYKGIPSKIIAENRLRVTEIKEREKIISMTNSDFEKLESKKLLTQSTGFLKQQNHTTQVFFLMISSMTGTRTTLGQLLYHKKDKK